LCDERIEANNGYGGCYINCDDEYFTKYPPPRDGDDAKVPPLNELILRKLDQFDQAKRQCEDNGGHLDEPYFKTIVGGFTNSKIFKPNPSESYSEEVDYFPYEDDYTGGTYDILPNQVPNIYEQCRDKYNTEFDPESVYQALKDMGLMKVSGISSYNGKLYDYKINFQKNVFEQWNANNKLEGVIGTTVIDDLFLHTQWPVLLAVEGGELYSKHGKRRAMFTFELDTTASEITLSKMVGHAEGEIRFWLTLNSCFAEEISPPVPTTSTSTTPSTTTKRTTTTSNTDSGPTTTDSGPTTTDSGPNPTDSEDSETVDDDDSNMGALIGGIVSATVIAGAAVGAGFYYTGGSSGGDYEFEDMEFASHSDEVGDKEQFVDMGRIVRSAMQNQ